MRLTSGFVSVRYGGKTTLEARPGSRHTDHREEPPIMPHHRGGRMDYLAETTRGAVKWERPMDMMVGLVPDAQNDQYF